MKLYVSFKNIQNFKLFLSPDMAQKTLCAFFFNLTSFYFLQLHSHFPVHRTHWVHSDASGPLYIQYFFLIYPPQLPVLFEIVLTILFCITSPCLFVVFIKICKRNFLGVTFYLPFQTPSGLLLCLFCMLYITSG